MELLKTSFSSSATCGPSGLLGALSRNLRLLPQPRLARVSTPVVAFVPDAYRQSFCEGTDGIVKAYILIAAHTIRRRLTHRLHRLVQQSVGEVGTLDVRIGQITPAVNPSEAERSGDCIVSTHSSKRERQSHTL